MDDETGEKGVWVVLSDPQEYDWTKNDVLETFRIKEDTIIFLMNKKWAWT